jgi:hypothetical protein
MVPDKNILVVYNLCGIKYDNIGMWLNHLEDIAAQNYPNFTIAISGCIVSETSKKKLEEFKNKYKNVVLNFIDEKLPVNITFNHTVQVCSNEFGVFDAYLYVASDVKFDSDKDVLSKLTYLHFNSNSAITNALVDHDAGLEAAVAEEQLDEIHKLLETSHFIINIGKGVNGHVMMWDKEVYLNFNHKIIPDIFASHCTEATYCYIAASLGKKMVLHNKDIILRHIGFADGHSAGFIEEIQYNDDVSWKHLFKSKIPAAERLLNDEAKASGFGYGEWKNPKLLARNESMYDENEDHVEPKKLLNFLKTGIYLTKEEFNYNNINYQLIK